MEQEAIPIEKEKCRIILNKSIYIRTSMSDLRNVLMQYFHYSYIKNKPGDETEMLLTDTDCLMYRIETKNFYEDLCKGKELSDFSDYPKGSKYYNTSKNLDVGKMKDETSGVPVKDFVGLTCILS